MVWIMSLVGLVILLLSGDLLVRGAVNLSMRLGVPALIVSLTIVAFGTSAPELLIAISAVDDGASGIAVGNVIGSNIANIFLVLGVPALLFTMDFSKCDTRRDFAIMLAATVVFIILAATGQYGVILLTLPEVLGFLVVGFVNVGYLFILVVHPVDVVFFPQDGWHSIGVDFSYRVSVVQCFLEFIECHLLFTPLYWKLD